MEFFYLVASVLVVIGAVGYVLVKVYRMGGEDKYEQGFNACKVLMLEQQNAQLLVRSSAPPRLLPGSTFAVIPPGYQMSRTPAPRAANSQERAK